MDDSPSRLPTAGIPPDRAGQPALAPGRVLGNRYEIRQRLGRGGMGEVWLAYDMRLRVEVALKALLTRVGSTELLHREIRAAREVISPNVCRIFDLVEADGLELLSMEYVDGITLRTLLEEKSPLGLLEAQEIAAQFLAGLEAIHAAGFVHRDFKPENVMMTRTGRVLVMDFGLAKPSALEPATIAGTRPYMAPEQMRGRPVDRRADVFSAGVVLAEMIDPYGVRDSENREKIWISVRDDPPRLPDTLWSAVLRRGLSHDPNSRYESASALSRALEEVTRKVGPAEEKSPYPGLASFSEAEAENFFGREAEVESIWRKLGGPARLLGVIGPSGAGKSSLLRAGVIPSRPESWRVLITTPGNRPFAALASVLAPDVAGDVESIAGLARLDESDIAVKLLGRWRRRYGGALLVVDQFEELFTLSSTETQSRFAELLSRLPVDADVHVLLSMRDDFLIHCHDYESLAPLFSELTPLKAPAGDALRRALVQPALKHGYRFEDEELIEEIVEQVSGERGALPLAAFAMAQLWEKRDRASGVLIRRAYEEIGGVAGALAQHAEATLDRIGSVRTPIVRELFRNLVTAHGTRAARDREELLSLFPNWEEATAVLNALIDARLLTSYEERRVEIIHESLLSAWPRLVHWQAQDAEGALLRDHLRQAAQLWEERERAKELLWSGSAYREFVVWRSRYTGALSAGEEAFARAMISNAERRKRRMRLAFASVLVVAIAIAGILAVLWRRSEVSEQQARAETQRAEAQKLLALSQVELERYPTAALAYVTKSLEVADTPEARQRVMEILWRGPIARILPILKTTSVYVTFSPDGKWLAVTSAWGSDALVPADGTPVRRIENPPAVHPTTSFSADSRFLAIQGSDDSTLRVFSVPDGHMIRTIPNDEGQFVSGASVITMSRNERANLVIQSWPFTGRSPLKLGRIESDALFDLYTKGELDPNGSRIVFPRDQGVYAQAIGDPMKSPKLLWNVGQRIIRADLYEGGQTICVRTEKGLSLRFRDGGVRSIEATSLGADYLTVPNDIRNSKVVFAARTGQASRFRVWDLDAPPSSAPLQLRWPTDHIDAAVDPTGEWTATSGLEQVALWPLKQPYLRFIPRDVGYVFSGQLLFTADSKHLISCGNASGVKRWSVTPPEASALVSPLTRCVAQAMDRRSSNVIAGGSVVFLISLAGEPPRKMLDAGRGNFIASAAFDATGEIAAVYIKEKNGAAKRRVQIIRIGSGNIDSLPIENTSAQHGNVDEFAIRDLGFASDGMLYSAGNGGIRRWDISGGECQTFRAATTATMAMSSSGRYILAALGEGQWGETSTVTGDLILFDLQTGLERRITTHAREFDHLAIDDGGEIIATADRKGVVRVGKASGEQPHLLVEDLTTIYGLAITPDRKWIASGTTGNIRLWPMPDLSKPPLHTLPHDELMGKLRDLTNLRAVPDLTSPSGYRLDIGPFPGWRKVPTWQ